MYTFCTDVGVDWNNTGNTPYTAKVFAGATGVPASGNPTWSAIPEAIQNAAWIYQNYYVAQYQSVLAGANTSAGESQAAGIQLAIWKVLYDTTMPSGKLDNASLGSASANSGNYFDAGVLTASGFAGGLNVADTILAALETARTAGNEASIFSPYTETWLSPNNNNSQGLIAPVPEPTTLIAGAMLLLPFGASTLRTLRRSRSA
jgi:hypothetical protein